MTKPNKYTCPCCGYKTFSEPPGSFELCPVCYWEDEALQLRFPLDKGANSVSLVEAQINFEKYGVSENSLKIFVRPAFPDEEKDKNWRKINPKKDKIETKSDWGEVIIYPSDPTRLYYWEKTYWKNEKTNRKSSLTETDKQV